MWWWSASIRAAVVASDAERVPRLRAGLATIAAMDTRDVSYWLATAGDDLAPRPALDGSTDADVAILGAGLTGLWTAFYLARRDPSLRIVILERETAGFGASGRNGAWCAPDLNISMGRLARLHGEDSAPGDAAGDVRLGRRGRPRDRRGRDRRRVPQGRRAAGGARPARRPEPRGGATRSTSGSGSATGTALLDAAETAAKVRIAGAIRGLFTDSAAVIHPGRLVRGLARHVEALGVVIHEGTAVTGFRPKDASGRAALVTDRGEVRAPVIVLAGEAYLTELPALHRQLIPLWSLIVLTEPVSDAPGRRSAGRTARSSPRPGCRSTTCRGPRTAGSCSAAAARRTASAARSAPSTTATARRTRGSRASSASGSPCSATSRSRTRGAGRSGCRATGTRRWRSTRATGIATARGYIGHGVSTTNLAGRVLTDLITGTPSPLTTLPLVNHRSPNWEVEPFRWIGVRYAQWAVGRLDATAERTGRPPTGRSIAERLAAH